MKDWILILRNLKRYRAACALHRQMCINNGSWNWYQTGTYWLVREGESHYRQERVGTQLELVPGVQVYGEA